MNKILILLLFLFSVSLSAQDVKDKQLSKLDEFTSERGVILKLQDYKLPNVKLRYGTAESRIRRVKSGSKVGHFHQLTMKGKYGSKSASIAYEDVVEIQKAIVVLEKEAQKDVAISSDYLENKFISEDGVELGYYVSKGELGWYIKLDKYGTDNTLFFKDLASVKATFQEAKDKIEEVK